MNDVYVIQITLVVRMAEFGMQLALDIGNRMPACIGVRRGEAK
jgi:hypothetical protein